MWRSLPDPVRAEPRAARVEALHAKALVGTRCSTPPPSPSCGPASSRRRRGGRAGGVDGAQVIGWILAALFVVCAVIGVVTVLGWLVPGT